MGPGFRRHPRLSYVPCRLSMVPRLFHGPLPPDVVVVHTTTPRDGRVSLGVEVNVLPAALEAARARGALVVAQLNPRMPWTYGDAEVDVADIDLGVEVDVPLRDPPARRPRGTTPAAIGALVAAQIGDGSTAAGRDRRGARTRRSPGSLERRGPAGLDRDVQRRGAGPGAGRGPRPRRAADDVLRVRQRRSSTRGWTATRGCG